MTTEEIVDARSARALERLKAFLAIPSISTDSAYRQEVERCADFVLGEMQEAGLDARMIRGEGYPLIYGEWLGAPGKPTVLIYGHYDVQPPDPLEEWRNDPFEATLEGDLIVARVRPTTKGSALPICRA